MRQPSGQTFRSADRDNQFEQTFEARPLPLPPLAMPEHPMYPQYDDADGYENGMDELTPQYSDTIQYQTTGPLSLSHVPTPLHSSARPLPVPLSYPLITNPLPTDQQDSYGTHSRFSVQDTSSYDWRNNPTYRGNDVSDRQDLDYQSPVAMQESCHFDEMAPTSFTDTYVPDYSPTEELDTAIDSAIDPLEHIYKQINLAQVVQRRIDLSTEVKDLRIGSPDVQENPFADPDEPRAATLHNHLYDEGSEPNNFSGNTDDFCNDHNDHESDYLRPYESRTHILATDDRWEIPTCQARNIQQKSTSDFPQISALSTDRASGGRHDRLDSTVSVPSRRSTQSAYGRSHTSSTLPVVPKAPKRNPIPHSLTSTTETLSLTPVVIHDTRPLASKDYDECDCVWSRRSIHSWLRTMRAETMDDVIVCLIGLFTHQVPTLSDQLARSIAKDLFESYCSAQEVQISESSQSLTYSPDAGQGVLPTFTQDGCYSSRGHSDVLAYQCYSSRCARTLPLKFHRPDTVVSDPHDWAQFWGLKPDENPLAQLSKTEIQRQYQIHELIYSETDFLSDLRILLEVFRANLKKSGHGDDQLDGLVFGDVPDLVELSERYLEQQLRERQLSQGPVIKSIGDIFLEWIPRAEQVYVKYAAQLCYADRAIRAQQARFPSVKEWLSICEADPRTKKLSFSSFQGAPTRRMQRYALLLSDVLKRTAKDSSDFNLLERAIEAVKETCQQCDAQVEIAKSKIALLDLQERLIWRVSQKDLGLSEPSRTIRFRGELEKKSETYTQWQTRDVVLLDNFLLCLKPGKNGFEKICSKMPIPVDYLMVDDCDEVLYKSSSTKLLGGTMTRHAVSPSADERHRTFSAQSPTALEGGNKALSRSLNLYPFTLKHAGRYDRADGDEKITFYAESAAVRLTWIKEIYAAKAARWLKFNDAEPFHVNILSDRAFGAATMPAGFSKTVAGLPGVINGIEAALDLLPNRSSKHICLGRVECASIFVASTGHETLLIGTDDGVYANHTGEWTRLLSATRVTQIAVLQSFGVLIVLADRTLVAYTLDDLLHNTDLTSRRPPQKLSDSREVSFFEVGIMKDRMLVIYKKRTNSNSVFHVLEPVVGKKHEKTSFFKKKSGTDFFRDFDVRGIEHDSHQSLTVLAILHPGRVLWAAVPEVGHLYSVLEGISNHVAGQQAARKYSKSGGR